MEQALKYLLIAIALVAAATGLNVLIGGAQAVPGVTGPVEATVDNELRFFATFWVAYGVFCWWITKNMRERLIFIPPVAIVFFLGGIARLISFITTGAPSVVLVGAMFLEFVIPLILYILYRKQGQAGAPNPILLSEN